MLRIPDGAALVWEAAWHPTWLCEPPAVKSIVTGFVDNAEWRALRDALEHGTLISFELYHP